MGQKYVHSTCGQPMVFNVTEAVDPKSDQQNVRQIAQITIGGGAYVITRDSRIPKVVITPVTDDELEMLRKNGAFVNMEKRGFFVVREENHMVADSKSNPDNMEIKDNCSQIRDDDHANGTDPRCDHAGTRAFYGVDNQYGGLQPLSVKETNYGEINM